MGRSAAGDTGWQNDAFTPVRGAVTPKQNDSSLSRGWRQLWRTVSRASEAVASVARMRWDHLFDDLAGQLEHELRAEEADLQQEEERLRLGRLSLRDRIAALHRAADPEARRIRYRTRSGELHAVRPLTVGRDWMAGDLDGRPGAQGVVPFSAIDALLLERSQVEASLAPAPEQPVLAARLGIAFLLRDLCRRRTALSIETGSGIVTGTIDRVGRDHLDLAVHELDVPRRESAVDHIRVVALDQVLLLRL